MKTPPEPVLSENATAARRSGPSSSPPTGSSSASKARFEPGEIVASRYQVVRPLGRGGMGEVYLARDLTLDQEVALKFLPASLAGDTMRLALFHNEVRVARKVTHKNVCRIFDIGDVSGQPFLSMEYVDGEDLASLLRRIGRLPEDKGLEIGRQLCAGLAAAHDEGILHRDLKPANVMLDGKGQVRITDFGLAGLASEIRDLGSGTPAYMAPEQLRGVDVSVESDIYALGLILYELFTGKRAFDVRSLKDRLESADASDFELPSSAVRGLTEATEAAILQCLESDPARRPGSALQVAAILPGADPLAEALAAGKTPSPEMVAAAGARSALAPKRALAGLLGVLGGSFLFAVLQAPHLLIQRVPLTKPTLVLVDRAEGFIQASGYASSLRHRVYGFRHDRAELDFIQTREDRPERWSALAASRPGVIRFWHRSSPERLVAIDANARANPDDPPMTLPGMVFTELDSEGRLVTFAAVPPQRSAPVALSPPDWEAFFARASLPMEAFEPAEPEWTPPSYADARQAWEGRVGGVPYKLRVEAASFQGKAVHFRVLGPWDKAKSVGNRERPAQVTLASSLAVTFILMVLLGSVALAWRNLKLGRGDRVGAKRIAGVVFLLDFTSTVGTIEHFADPVLELGRWIYATTSAVFGATLFAILSIALQPYVRRSWPHGLIAWNRLLGGSYRDPLVGRDILVGASAGALISLMDPVRDLLLGALALPTGIPESPGLVALLGARFQLFRMTDALLLSVNNTMLMVFVFVVLRLLLKRTLPAAVATFVTFGLLTGGQILAGGAWSAAAILFANVGVAVAILVRFGLLAAVTQGTVIFLLRMTPFTLELGSWYAGPTFAALCVLTALALYAFYCSRGGEPVFGKPLIPT